MDPFSFFFSPERNKDPLDSGRERKPLSRKDVFLPD